ncbi:MAG: hypothetical protein ACQEQF_04915, partial [Bacillota bacterium]
KCCGNVIAYYDFYTFSSNSIWIKELIENVNNKDKIKYLICPKCRESANYNIEDLMNINEYKVKKYNN